MVVFYPRGAFGLTLLANTDSLPELYSIIDYVIQETFHLEPSEPIFRYEAYPFRTLLTYQFLSFS